MPDHADLAWNRQAITESVLEVANIWMLRKMLRTVRDRAEAAARTDASPCTSPVAVPAGRPA